MFVLGLLDGPPDEHLGLLKTAPDIAETEWIAFAMSAKRAAVGSGLSSDWAAQMVAAIGEFRSNIIEHSGVPETGLVAFCASPGLFEFVASDRGVGLVATLREAPEYNTLSDSCEALRLALTDGASRFGFDHGRGYGFRPLFTGLANRQASLRFRTGTGALTIDGTTPSLVRAQMGRNSNWRVSCPRPVWSASEFLGGRRVHSPRQALRVQPRRRSA